MMRWKALAGTRHLLLLSLALGPVTACSPQGGETLRLRRELLHQQETNQKLRQELQTLQEAFQEARDGQEALFEKLEKMIQENRRLRNRLSERENALESLIPDTDATGAPEEPPPGKASEAN